MQWTSRKAAGGRTLLLFASGLLIFGLVVFWPLMGRHRRAVGAANAPADESSGEAAGRRAARAAAEALALTAAESVQAVVDGRWENFRTRVQAAVNDGPERVQAYLWTLFTAFDALETQAQEPALRAFFESGVDVRFGYAFVIGRGGWLTEWPTLRVALFDYVSQRNAPLAQALAWKILATKSEEPGEWTLALRDLAREKTAAEWPPELRAALWEFIYDPKWAAEGRAAWLEGFDVVVAGRDAKFLENLAEVANTGVSRAAQFAAFLAADRMMLVDPLPTLRTLNDETYLLADATGLRAGIFARADVRDAAQLVEIERYLLREDVGAGERSHFLSLYPHYNPVVAQKLLTPSPKHSMADMAASRKAALEQIERWVGDARFAAWHGALREVAARLRQQLAE